MSFKLLVVDDDPVSRSFLSMQLGFLGVAAQVAGSGPEALRKAEETIFDMILLDCQMPEFDGFWTAGALREAGYAGPIVGLSAEEGEVIRENCLRAGMNGHRPKPIDMGVAHELIQTYLQLATAPAEGLGAPAVSSDPLARVRAMVEKSGKPEQAQRLVEVFVRSNDGVVERLGEALARSDQGAALFQLHRLKGSAGSFGAEEFGHRTLAVEERVTADGLALTATEVRSLIALWQELRSYLLAGIRA